MVAETTDKRGASPYRWWMLFLICFLEFIVAAAPWTIMPVLFQEIAQPKDIGLGLSLVQLGAIWGIMPLALALFSIPGGMSSDRYGVRWVIGFGVFLMAVAGALRGTSGSFASLLVWMFLFGVGYSAISANVPKFVGTWFEPKDLGMANGIVFSCYGLGTGFAIQFGGSFFSPAVGGWRNALYILGAISLAVGVLWLMSVPNPKTNRAATGATGSPQSLFHGLTVGFRTRDVWLLVAVQMLFLAGNMGALGYIPIYLTGLGLSKSVAHGYAAISSYTFLLGATLIPMLSDRIGSRILVFSVTIAISGLGLIAVPFVCCGSLLPVALATGGFFAGGFVIPRVVILEHPRIGVALAGSVFGFVASMGFLGAFISPMIGNAIAVKSGGASAIIMWGSFMLLAAVVFLFVTETHPRRVAKNSQVGSP